MDKLVEGVPSFKITSEIDDIYLRSTAMARRNGFMRRVENARNKSSPNLVRFSGPRTVKSTELAAGQSLQFRFT